jgi:hypothetical protein
VYWTVLEKKYYSAMEKRKTGRPAPKKRKLPANARKRDPGHEFDEAISKVFDEHFAAMRESRERERVLFQATVESLRTATTLERAEGPLRFWADRLDVWGNHEAVVYLVSRGSNPSEYSRNIIANWRGRKRKQSRVW